MKHFYLGAISAFFSITLLAQPSATPATGYQWVKTSSSSFISGPTSTTPSYGTSTQFGLAGDSDPVSCASYCGGRCDATSGTIFDKLYGANNGTDPQSLCEQRAVTLTNWNNTNPNSGVSNGASSGTVYLPTSSTVDIRPGTNAPGTGEGGTNNRGWIIGGWGPGNNSKFNAKMDYSLDWYVPSYGLSGGSGTVTQTGTFEGGEPGGSGYNQTTVGWSSNFGQTFSQSFTIPTGSIATNGSSVEVIFVGNATATVTSQVYGNADGMMAADPGMEGRASLTTNYDIWELKPIVTPINLLSINVATNQNGNTIKWTTTNETNNSGYTVQVSTDGVHFSDLGFVPSSTIRTNGNYNYQYFDSRNYSTKVYYRLALKENNGAVVFSKIISVDNAKNSTMQIVNSNEKNIFTLKTNLSENTTAIITNTNGQTIQKLNIEKGNALTNLDLTKASAGIYFVTLQLQKEGILANKILVQ